MPPEGEEAPKPAEIEVLKAWIAAGAKGPSGAAADPTTLVTPQIKLLAPAKLAINAIALSPTGSVLAIARHGEVELQSLPESQDGAQALRHSRPRQRRRVFARWPVRCGRGRRAGLVWRSAAVQCCNGAKWPGTAVVLSHTEFRGHKDSLYCAALSPDGKILATGGYDNAIKLWNVASGKELRTLDGHNGAVFELAFRPDGKVLASASGDRTVKLWNVATGERLDTLKESHKELYSLAFSPDGTRLAAAGVDNRIRVWQVTPEAKEGDEPAARFASSPTKRPFCGSSGRPTARRSPAPGEDRLVKIWNADTMTIRQTLEKQPDWASGLAISADGRTLVVGRIDGSLGIYQLAPPAAETERPLVAAGRSAAAKSITARSRRWISCRRSPKSNRTIGRRQATRDFDAGHRDGQASFSPTARRLTAADRRHDLFRFDAKAGDQWIIETNAARSNSPLDTKIEVLDAAGQPVPRLLLRAVRDSVIEFRGMNSEQRGVRLANWEEMLLNEYVYLSGEVIKLFQQRRGPDADAQFYPENGNRFAYLRHHQPGPRPRRAGLHRRALRRRHRAAQQRPARLHAQLRERRRLAAASSARTRG